MRTSVLKKIGKHRACPGAVVWLKTQPNEQVAWDACERGDWMLWLLGRLSGPPESEKRKQLVLAACDCASLALKHAGKNRAVALACLRMARAWVRGNATIEQVRTAAAAAADADADAYAAAYAAAAAAAAADDDDAAYAAYAAAAAADDAAAARTKTLKQCASIVRKYYPNAPLL